MKGRILLIYPWIYDFAAYCEWTEPLGLLSIAALLRENGYQVGLIDCLDRRHPKLPSRLSDDAFGCGKFLKTPVDKPPALRQVPRRYGRYGLPTEVFQEELGSQPRPDAIMVTSAMTYWYPGPFEAIKRVKVHFPGVPVILGGVYATLCYNHAREKSGADYVVRGEGELHALRLVDGLTGNRSDMDRLSRNLDALPRPLHELRTNQGYAAIQTSRGCPFQCTYCASSLLHPQGFRRRDPRRVADEIEYCFRQLGIRDFAFYDDALLVEAESHIHVLLDEVLRRGLACRFHTPNGLHARYIDRALAAKMYQAGFTTVRLGLETADAHEQRRTGSKVTNSDFQEAVGHLRAAGFKARQITAYILMGLPGQSAREVMDSVDFVHECGALVQITLYSLIPGTLEWERAVHEGHIDARADPLLHNDSIYPFPWCPASLEDFERAKARATAGNHALAVSS
ncbi:MAG TPA: radical SAM protein [Anaerolineae bacterium]|nr:radical SAM protein [Anaerolineae bacterium]